jgi:hypothetical protein
LSTANFFILSAFINSLRILSSLLIMERDSCPFCGKVVTGPNATFSINRHIKKEAEKPIEKRGRHPSQEDDVYLEQARQRRFHSKTKTTEERSARRYETQKKYMAKRKARDLEKVQAANEGLRYHVCLVAFAHTI